MLTLSSNYHNLSVRYLRQGRRLRGSRSLSVSKITRKVMSEIKKIKNKILLMFEGWAHHALVILVFSTIWRRPEVAAHVRVAAELDTGRRFIHFIRILVPNPPLLFSPPGKMSAPVVLRSSGPALCPSFAEVCSFLERYGAALDLPEMTFPQMERYLRDTTTGERSPVLLLLLPELGSVESCDTRMRRRPPPSLWQWRKTCVSHEHIW